MSIPPRIIELRLSFAWTETWPNLLAGDAQDAPMAFLGSRQAYAERWETVRTAMAAMAADWQRAYEQAYFSARNGSPEQRAKATAVNEEYRQKLNAAGVLTPPWPMLWTNYIHHFWQFYLENTAPDRLTGDRAWQYLVPFRVGIPARIGTPWPAAGPRCPFILDGFLYPHGIAAVMMVRLLFKQQDDDGEAAEDEPGAGLLYALQRAHELRREASLPVQLANAPAANLKLDTLGGRLLDYLRAQVLGPNSDQGNRLGEPISVATVIQGRGGDPDTPVPEDGDIHRLLQGLCTWSDEWANEKLARPLSAANLLLGNAPPGNIVYHSQQGRAVWMPDNFNQTSGRGRYKLSCYHRNLMLVCLQTEMLAQTNALFVEYLDRGEEVPAELADLARFAAIRLGFLYAAKKNAGRKYTYNSASPRFYLADNVYVDTINRARKSFAKPLGELSYTPR